MLNSSFCITCFRFIIFIIKRLLLTFVCSVFKEQLVGRSRSDFINLTCSHIRVNNIFYFLFRCFLSCRSDVSVAQSCLTLWDPVACRTLGFRVHHQLQGLAQTHVHRIRCHPTILASVVPFSSAFNQDSHRQIFSSVISVHSLSKSSYHI